MPIPGDLQLQPGKATIVAVLRLRAMAHPGKRAFTFLEDGSGTEESITFAELEIQSRKVATRLHELGLKNTKVLLFYPSGLEFITAFFGCLYAGVIPVPAYPPRKNRLLRRIHAIAANCGAVSILTTDGIARSLERNFSDDPLLNKLSWHSTESWSSSGQPMQDFDEPGFEEVAFLQYTSGSTGDPKGVMVSHRNIMFNLRSLQIFFRITNEDVLVNWVPQFHDLGLIFGVLETVFAGIHAILISPVTFISDPFFFLQTISRFRATICGQPDFAFNLCVDKTNEVQRSSIDLSSLHAFYSGAEPVRKSTFERFASAFSAAGLKPEALFPAYGMAESTLIITGIDPNTRPFYLPVIASELEQHRVVPASAGDADIRWITSNGKPNMDTSILIADPDTREILPADVVGEIWASGSTITMGYYGLPGLTGEVFNATPEGLNAASWLRTGDLGFLHNGELFITGRLKDLVIIHGSNYYPQDIELTVEESHSAIRKTCTAAFSIEVNGEEKLAMVAELRRSIIPHDTEKIMDDMVSAISREFEIQPARIALVRIGSLPKTSSGKLMRNAAKQFLLTGKFEIIAERSFEDKNIQSVEIFGPESSNLEPFLLAWVSHHLNKGNPVDPAGSLASFGMDSLKAVELSSETKDIFGFEWPPYLFFEEISMQQLVAEGLKLMEEMGIG